MKIEITINFPQLSTRGKRILAAVAIPAVLLGGAAVAWAGLPHSWTAGETLTAQNLTDDFDALDKRLAAVEASAPTAWATYTCQVVDASTGVAVGGDTSTCVSRRTGNSIDVRILSIFSSPPGVGHKMSWDLPPNTAFDATGLPSAQQATLGVGYSNGSAAAGGVLVAPSAGLRVFAYYVSGGAAVSTSDGFATGVISLSFSVPVLP